MSPGSIVSRFHQHGDVLDGVLQLAHIAAPQRRRVLDARNSLRCGARSASSCVRDENLRGNDWRAWRCPRPAGAAAWRDRHDAQKRPGIAQHTPRSTALRMPIHPPKMKQTSTGSPTSRRRRTTPSCTTRGNRCNAATTAGRVRSRRASAVRRYLPWARHRDLRGEHDPLQSPNISDSATPGGAALVVGNGFLTRREC